VRILESSAGPQRLPRDSEGDERFLKGKILLDELRDILKTLIDIEKAQITNGWREEVGLAII
jgi:hypothetical protein